MRRIAPTEVPAGLVEHSLWWGCDPSLLIALGMICMIVAGTGVGYLQWSLLPVAFVMFWGGRTLLTRLAKKHPQQHLFIQRAWSQQRLYDACGRWDERPKRPGAWT